METFKFSKLPFGDLDPSIRTAEYYNYAWSFYRSVTESSPELTNLLLKSDVDVFSSVNMCMFVSSPLDVKSCFDLPVELFLLV